MDKKTALLKAKELSMDPEALYKFYKKAIALACILEPDAMKRLRAISKIHVFEE